MEERGRRQRRGNSTPAGTTGKPVTAVVTLQKLSADEQARGCT